MFYDTHAHLDYPEFTQELPEVIARATTAGITRILSVGTDLESSRRAVALAEAHPEVWAVVGWHPANVMSAPPNLEAELHEVASHPRVVAIGETGMDFYRLPSTQSGNAADDSEYKERQADLLAQQLRVAADLGLNVVIHQRAALDAALEIFEPYTKQLRGVFHCFSEAPAVQQRIHALGSLVSFTGIVTFKKADDVRETVRRTPLGQFMLETDCPYLSPEPFRRNRCEPAYVRPIAEKIAEIHGCDLATLSRSTCDTAHKFFPKMH